MMVRVTFNATEWSAEQIAEHIPGSLVLDHTSYVTTRHRMFDAATLQLELEDDHGWPEGSCEDRADDGSPQLEVETTLTAEDVVRLHELWAAAVACGDVVFDAEGV